MKQNIILICTLASLLLCNPMKTLANNLSLGDSITIVNSTDISFTIKWDNSWYTAAPANWDAAWIFVKYKDCSGTNWLHAPLSTTLANHSVSGGSGLLKIEMPAVNNGNGVYIRRTALGLGNITTAEKVTLRLNSINTGSYNFKVFGIEMVYIPQGDFQIGDGGSTATFNNVTIDATKQTSGFANTSTAIGGTGTTTKAMAATYPMGYNAMYCMKYEITQIEYVDFLNSLTYDQQLSRTPVAPSIAATNWVMGATGATTGRGRNGLKMKTSGMSNTLPAEFACDLNNNGTGSGANYNDASDGQNIPCNYLNWSDVAAYLDWACLRPFTDLEFEKICRGVAGRVLNEYVWGTNISITQAAVANNDYYAGQSISNYGKANEVFGSSGSGLAAYGYTAYYYGTSYDISNNTPCCAKAVYVTGGPLRAGFAATATTDRQGAGATYYGVMDMPGNLWERVVAVDSAGVVFKGTLGDGALTTTSGFAGNATNTDWPGIDSTSANGVTGAKGIGKRGGSWYDAAAYLQTSNRALAYDADVSRDCRWGGRGVR